MKGGRWATSWRKSTAGTLECVKSKEPLADSTEAVGPGISVKGVQVRSGCAPCKGGAFQWVQAPPGNRSSRKQSEQSWR
jgi:hypothetical protein